MSRNLLSEQPNEDQISAYLGNRLSTEEAEAFEHYCLEHPHFARDVERELQLKIGFRQLSDSKTATAELPRHVPKIWWPLALAASIAVAIVAIFELRPVYTPAITAVNTVTELPITLRLAPRASVALIRLRGANEPVTIAAPLESVIELRFLPDLGEEPTIYSLQATEESSHASFTASGLRPSVDGYLRVYVPAKPLINKVWLLTLKPATTSVSQSHAQVYRLRVTALVNSAG